GAADAQRFAQRLAARLGIEGGVIREAYEDWPYYLWREAKAPLGAKIEEKTAADAAGSGDDLALALARGLDRPVGYALPLNWDWSVGGWRSGHWNFARGTMYLIPG